MSLLSERKEKFRELANENLTGTELEDCLFAIDDAVDEVDMKEIKDNTLSFPEKDLAKMKTDIETYVTYLTNRGITWEVLSRRKEDMLNATTQQEFVAAYKW